MSDLADHIENNSIPYEQIVELSELAFDLGIKIDTIRLNKIPDDKITVSKVETPYGDIKIKYD